MDQIVTPPSDGQALTRDRIRNVRVLEQPFVPRQAAVMVSIGSLGTVTGGTICNGTFIDNLKYTQVPGVDGDPPTWKLSYTHSSRSEKLFIPNSLSSGALLVCINQNDGWFAVGILQ